MQDKYVGDIGDYGKLTLLRRIAESGLRLGVVWCVVDDLDEKNNHGSLRKYRGYTGKALTLSKKEWAQRTLTVQA